MGCMGNLDLIAYFQEIPLKDYEYEVKAHPAHDTIDIEQVNVLNDLIGRIQESTSNSLTPVVMSGKQSKNISSVFLWTQYLKIMVLSVIGFILFLICVRIFIALNPFPKLVQQLQNTHEKRKRKKHRIVEKELETRTPMLAQTTATAPTYPKITNNETQKSLNPIPEHSHNHCTYVVGKGLIWEDLCPCASN